MSEPRIQIVDEQDRPIGGATKQEAFEKGLICRLVRGITEDEHGRLLLNKRAPSKLPHPNLWDWLPSGHVDEGETYDQALLRETKEELGIDSKAMQFTPIETYYTSRKANGLQLNNFNRVYKVVISSATPIRLDETEATEFRWLTPQELSHELQTDPNAFTPGVHLLFPKYYES